MPAPGQTIKTVLGKCHSEELRSEESWICVAIKDPLGFALRMTRRDLEMVLIRVGQNTRLRSRGCHCGFLLA